MHADEPGAPADPAIVDQGPPLRRLFLLALAGGVLGFLAESVHLQAGVWALRPGAAFPWWITLVYFFGLAGAGRLFHGVECRAGRRLSVSRRALAFEITLFLLLFFAPIVLHRFEIGLAVLVTGILALRLVRFRVPGDVQVAILALTIDLVAESTLVGFGMYRYPEAHWLPLPLWLAPFWGALGLGLRRFFVVALGASPGKS